MLAGPRQSREVRAERQQLTRAGNCRACLHRQVAVTQLVHLRLSLPCGNRNHLAEWSWTGGLRNSLRIWSSAWMILGLSSQPCGKWGRFALTDPVYPDAADSATSP